MRRCHLQLTLCAILTAQACASPTAQTTTVRVPVTRVVDGFGLPFGLEQPATLTVRDRDTWQSIWIQIHRRGSTVPSLPEIDFSTDMVVVAALGAQPSSGYGVTITGASETNGVVTVEADSSSPGRNCVTLTVITYPTDIVRMPRRSGAVQFQITPRVIACQ